MKHKRVAPKPRVPILLFWTLLVSILLATSYSLGHSNGLLSLTTKAKEPNEANEDSLSMKQIPPDVLAALNGARSSSSPVLGIHADGPTYHLPILMYHYVEHVKDPKDTIRMSLNTLPEVLDKQIETLVQAGYHFLTPSDLADILDGIEKMPEKPVILSFDDGYRDFYTDAFPIIRKHNVRAVAYVISNFLDRNNYLTLDQLKTIANSGLVEIGAHTENHLALRGLPKNIAEKEISGSRIQLEQILGRPITAFAYPYGSFDLPAIQISKQAGFRTAVSTVMGSQTDNAMRFFAPRIRPGMRTGSELLSYLEKN